MGPEFRWRPIFKLYSCRVKCVRLAGNVGPKNCAWVKSMGLKTLVKYNRVLNGLGYPSDEHLYSDETSQDCPIRISHFLSLINLLKLLL